MGRLLLKEQPNDAEVELRLLGALIDIGRNKKDFESLLAYALKLRDKYPSEYFVLGRLSSIYSSLANIGADPTARDKEIAIYEQLLKEFKRRSQTPRMKESIRNVNQLLRYARTHRPR